MDFKDDVHVDISTCNPELLDVDRVFHHLLRISQSHACGYRLLGEHCVHVSDPYVVFVFSNLPEHVTSHDSASELLEVYGCVHLNHIECVALVADEFSVHEVAHCHVAVPQGVVLLA